MLQFQPMRRIEFKTGHVIFNGAYNEIFQLKTTKQDLTRVYLNTIWFCKAEFCFQILAYYVFYPSLQVEGCEFNSLQSSVDPKSLF